MLKIPEKFRKFIVPAIFVIIAIVSVLLTPLVKVNYNISDYLDDSSETKVSLNIMESEFGLNGSVQVMIRDIDVATANEVKETLEGMENVLIVNFDSQNENYYKNNIARFTVMTNGDEYSNTSRAVAAEIQETLEMIYERFPRLKERQNQLAGTLSGGEQQMLAMGRALMSHPKIILMDEPSMGLSPIYVNEIFKIIQDVSKSGTTVLLVEQNAKKALSIADRAYVLETGNIVLEGRASTLLDNDDIKKAYLGE